MSCFMPPMLIGRRGGCSDEYRGEASRVVDVKGPDVTQC
jgi:hypothetical protein